MSDSGADAVQIGSSADGSVGIAVRVRPGGRANRLVGVHAGALKVEVTSAPERGKANAAVVRLLSACLGVARKDVVIVSGLTGRSKRVALRGTSVRDVADRLLAAGIPAVVRSPIRD